VVARAISNLGWPEFFLYAYMDPSSSSLGYGATFNSHWFCGAWSTVQKPSLSAYKELFPIVVAASLWGSQWVAWQVEFYKAKCNLGKVNLEPMRSAVSPSLVYVTCGGDLRERVVPRDLLCSGSLYMLIFVDFLRSLQLLRWQGLVRRFSLPRRPVFPRQPVFPHQLAFPCQARQFLRHQFSCHRIAWP